MHQKETVDERCSVDGRPPSLEILVDDTDSRGAELGRVRVPRIREGHVNGQRLGQASRIVAGLVVSSICTHQLSGYNVMFRRAPVMLKKVDGDGNVAELGTKRVDGKRMFFLESWES